MLISLALNGVGPARKFPEITFAPRLNLLTGDNGLGKSFLLDVAWWALTRTWHGAPVHPRGGADSQPSIEFSLTTNQGKTVKYERHFDRARQEWTVKKGRPYIPGLVLYAGVDGGFSVWDPHRNYWLEQNPNRPDAFQFTSDQVWNGLTASGERVCNGLIADWVFWQKSRDPAFDDLCRVLAVLSPGDETGLTPGEPVRVGFDTTNYPSLRMPYGQDVPLIHASAGMKRIAALAYLLVWAWREHLIASEQTGKPPVAEIVFLIDEIECHLHPQWQRRIVPALLSVMDALTASGPRVSVQVIAATHSPLVLASAEPEFDAEKDALFTLELHDGQAVMEQRPWAKQGDITNWLVSEAFGLRQARSPAAEKAIEAAEAWMRGDHAALPPGLTTAEAIDRELRRVLADHDDFWPRWVMHGAGA